MYTRPPYSGDLWPPTSPRALYECKSSPYAADTMFLPEQWPESARKIGWWERVRDKENENARDRERERERCRERATNRERESEREWDRDWESKKERERVR
jgi:hypothetical protein